MNLNELPFGTIEKFNVVVEVREGTRTKYEMNEQTGFLQLDFVFGKDFSWLFNYGFIAGTRSGDGDRLDAMVVSSEPLDVGTVAPCRAIGMVELLDRGEVDNKIIAVPIADKSMADIMTFEDLENSAAEKIEEFYRQVSYEKNKIIEIKNFHGKQRAEQEISASIEK